MTDLTERLRKRADAWRYGGSMNGLYSEMTEAATTLETLTQEVERLRGLLIDPGDPAWEDARAVLVAELRKAGMDTHADNVAEGHALQIPSWIALNLIAHSRKSLTQENARLKAVSDDHFRNAQRLAGEVAKRDVENARLREALGRVVSVDQERHWTATEENPETHWEIMDGQCARIARKALGGGDE